MHLNVSYAQVVGAIADPRVRPKVLDNHASGNALFEGYQRYSRDAIEYTLARCETVGALGSQAFYFLAAAADILGGGGCGSWWWWWWWWW